MGRWFPVRVAGDSMLPTLRAGDLLALRAVREGEPRPGQIVVARRDAIEVVKRVHRVDDGRLDLRGDNAAASTDSRNWGSVTPDAVVGIVVFRYWPPRVSGTRARRPSRPRRAR